MEYNYESLFHELTRRYGDVEPEALKRVLCPLLVPIASLDKAVFKMPGQSHWRASFSTKVDAITRGALAPGRTGKFVPAAHLKGKPWREIAKGRILSVDHKEHLSHGEIYIGGGGGKAALEDTLNDLTLEDFLEIDQFGASSSILSALVESTLATQLEEQGFAVCRMPADRAKHIGNYANYDFEATRDGVTKKIEVKSLWGTDTRYARLIHSLGRDYKTSSCKFATQDFFAVSRFLKTGNIADFAFACSIPVDVKPYGLPRSSVSPEYVNQNPLCNPGDGIWFNSLHEI